MESRAGFFSWLKLGMQIASLRMSVASEGLHRFPTKCNAPPETLIAHPYQEAFPKGLSLPTMNNSQVRLLLYVRFKQDSPDWNPRRGCSKSKI